MTSKGKNRTVKLPNFVRDLRGTNVYAEYRGKYARAPVLNTRPITSKNNGRRNSCRPSSILIDSMPTIDIKKSKNFSLLPSKNIDSNEEIGELTRLLKIERLKRLIIKKKYESQHLLSTDSY